MVIEVQLEGVRDAVQRGQRGRGDQGVVVPRGAVTLLTWSRFRFR